MTSEKDNAAASDAAQRAILRTHSAYIARLVGEKSELIAQMEDIQAERDAAIRERDEAEQRYQDTAKALAEWHGRWVEMEHERDVWKARAEATERSRDAFKARAEAAKKARIEAAEARTAPTVTKAEVEKVIRGQWGGCFDGLTDAVWSLVSGDDPVVHVVRESDVVAVEVTRDFGGWCADGAWVAGADDTAEWVRGRAAEMVVYAASSEAVARAIEQDAASDPLLSKAKEFAALADWELTDREAELLHTVAAHVLGQETNNE